MEKKTRNELAFEFIDQVACTIVIATFFICAVVAFEFWGKDHLSVVATIIVANVAAYLWVHYSCKTKLDEANEHSEELEAELREIKENCERNSMPEHERYTLRMKNMDAKRDYTKNPYYDIYKNNTQQKQLNMNTITCTFDHHDYISAVEGFARGSHLRQHIWKMMVLHHFPQMDDDFLDYAWWILKRNLWEMYFPKPYTHNGETITPHNHVGAEDYLHALAILHRGNRYYVHTVYNGKSATHLCYKFIGNYYTLFDKSANRWTQYIAPEYIKSVYRCHIPKNKMVEYRHYDEWEDLSIYDNLPT